MASEIELKLSLPESAQRALLRHPLLKEAREKRTESLVTLYFDTPDLKLRRRGIALRLRRSGTAWVQTIKCAGQGGGGFSARPEWETPYRGGFDFSGIDDPSVRAFLDKRSIRERLLPAFETNFRRTTFGFEGLWLMFDRGWIATSGRRAPLSEIELELAGGTVADLFALAGRLAAKLPLSPAPESKAERGYRLFLDRPLAPVRAGPAALAAETYGRLTPIAAFRSIAVNCLEHLQRNHQGAATSDDPEFIHQMRVATRRLRAAMRLFAPVLPKDFSEALAPPLRQLMQILGAARDLDVLLHEVKAPVLAAMPDDPRLSALATVVAARRDQARQAASHYLASPPYGQLQLRLLDLLHRPPFTEAAPASESLETFSLERLQRLRRKLRRLAWAADVDDLPSLHALRIAIKRLRYALEFFAALPGGKRRARLAGRLTEAQGLLGQINDLATARIVLEQAAGKDPQLQAGAALVEQWHEHKQHQLLEDVKPLVAKLGRLPPIE